MKPCVTYNQGKEQLKHLKRHDMKKETFQEVNTHPHPAVVQLLGFHNNGPAFLPLDASVHTTYNTLNGQEITITRRVHLA